MQDNCSLLLLLEFISRGKISGAVPDITEVVSRAESPDAWKSENWLLAYECARNGWASDKHFQSEDHWAELLKLGISFFSTNSVSTTPPGPVTPPSPATPAPVPVTPPGPAPATPPSWFGEADEEEESSEQTGEAEGEEEEGSYE
jgi:hypothetical protein